MKLNDYILYWYKTYRQPGQARTTQITTMSCIRNHLLTAPLSDKELAEIDLRDIQTFLMEEYLHGKKTKLKYVDQTGEPLSAGTDNTGFYTRIQKMWDTQYNGASLSKDWHNIYYIAVGIS